MGDHNGKWERESGSSTGITTRKGTVPRGGGGKGDQHQGGRTYNRGGGMAWTEPIILSASEKIILDNSSAMDHKLHPQCCFLLQLSRNGQSKP